MPSDLPAELARWFQNMQRLLDRLAQTAEQQKQLHEMVKTLVRENAELREEINHLRNMVTAYVTAVKDQVLRRSREGRSPE